MPATIARILKLVAAEKAVAHTTPAPDRDEAIRAIRAALKRRTGHVWSVTGGRGTAWGWITVTTPPAHQKKHGRQCMSAGEAIALGKLLGMDGPVHHQGWTIPGQSDFRRDAVMRAETGTSTVHAVPNWD